MKPFVNVVSEAWVWQIRKIKKARDHLTSIRGTRGLGLYTYAFNGHHQSRALISIVKVKPFVWRLTMKHEMGHHKVTSQCNNLLEAMQKNAAYDKLTNHGKTQWRWRG